MNIKLSLVLALVIVGIFPAASIYAWQRANKTPEGPEFARNAAIDFILMNHEELRNLQIPSSWKVRNLTPEGWVGYTTWQYTGGGWTVEVSNAVVRVPTFSIEIEYAGGVSFLWKGTVDQDGNVVEMEYTVVQ